MVIDSSAIIAILFGEPEGENVISIIANAPKLAMSAFTALETAIVIEAKKGEAGDFMASSRPLTHSSSGYSGERPCFGSRLFPKIARV